ncbi:group II intron reverse transcriptase/maturase [Enterococcus faecium]|nr:group II intron reverse transcriptase/maturase [uncultured Blautia sp.]MCU1920523.1 group II intron reverse transcriptase/maturase [Enterococcus faecium]
MATKKKQTLRNSEYYDMQSTFDELYAKSQNGQVFQNLMGIICSEENIQLAYRNIKRNGGSVTPGVDGITIRDIEQMPAEKYIRTVQKKLAWYKPKPVKRVEIPKPNGGIRPLGIPTMFDRLVQQSIKQVLEPICEAKFHEYSYGFRPNRSAENAISKVQNLIHFTKLYYVVDMDIKGFFDNVNHSKLIKQMWSLGIRDKTLLCIIKEMLKAPIILPDGSKVLPQKGTPQGGVLSPLLANIVLNELDWWISSQWETHPTHTPYKIIEHKEGHQDRGSIYRALKRSNLKEMYIVRYADDFKIFCRKRDDANKAYFAIKQWLAERLKLEISEEKSKVVSLKRHYSEFLGFELKVVQKRKKWVVRSHMCQKAIQRETHVLIEQIKDMQHPQDAANGALAVTKYNAMVIGIHNYYQIATDVNLDCKTIRRNINICLHNRLRHKITKTGQVVGKYIRQRYGQSKDIQFIYGCPIAPIGSVQHKKPMSKKRTINSYTPEGRAEIHDGLKLNISILLQLMKTSTPMGSVEFMDNRLSLWCAQYGKCAITGRELMVNEIHCHHKIPKEPPFYGTDRYENLIIVHVDVHRLIHATAPETIAKYLAMLNLTKRQLNKVNSLRKSAGLAEIEQ